MQLNSIFSVLLNTIVDVLAKSVLASPVDCLSSHDYSKYK